MRGTSNNRDRFNGNNYGNEPEFFRAAGSPIMMASGEYDAQDGDQVDQAAKMMSEA
jgi:hypothetical protein